MHHGMTVNDIQEHDRKRIDTLKSLGYIVKIVWDHEYKTERERILKEIETIIEAIKDTVEIVEILKPIYNIKASKEEHAKF